MQHKLRSRHTTFGALLNEMRKEIAELVIRVAQEGARLTPLGSGLSWSGINEVENEHLLRLDRMTTIDVQPDSKRACVQGGR